MAGDVVDCIMRAGARVNLAIFELPESIAAHEYKLAEPPEASASWVEDLSTAAAALKDRLELVPELTSTLKAQVPASIPRKEASFSQLLRLGPILGFGSNLGNVLKPCLHVYMPASMSAS